MEISTFWTLTDLESTGGDAREFVEQLMPRASVILMYTCNLPTFVSLFHKADKSGQVTCI